MVFRDKRALSPVISGIILLAVTVTVAMVATTWLGSMSFSFMSIDELNLVNCQWAEDGSYADITIRNFGTSKITLNSVKINNNPATSTTFVSGNEIINGGEEAILRVFYDYSTSTKYRFSVATLKSNNFFIISTSPPDSSITFKMEWGTAAVTDDFTEIVLQNSYVNPVIVSTPKYDSGNPRTVRISDVENDSFSVRVQNPSGTSCPSTQINYMVIEEGVWTTPIKVEAFRYSTNTVGRKNSWNYDHKEYQQTYTGNIVVLHQVMSYNDPSWITTFVSRYSSQNSPPNSGDVGFRIALNGAEATNSHSEETVSYIIFEQGFGELSEIKFDVKRTLDSVSGYQDSPPYNTNFSQNFDNPPQVVLANHQEVDGGDGGWSVVHSINLSRVGLLIDEDQENDSERKHTSETCGFIAFQQVGSFP